MFLLDIATEDGVRVDTLNLVADVVDSLNRSCAHNLRLTTTSDLGRDLYTSERYRRRGRRAAEDIRGLQPWSDRGRSLVVGLLNATRGHNVTGRQLVILVSDGTGEVLTEDQAEIINSVAKKYNVSIFVVYVDTDADVNPLRRIS